MDVISTLIRGKYSVIKDNSYAAGHKVFQLYIEGGLIEVYLSHYMIIIEIV